MKKLIKLSGCLLLLLTVGCPCVPPIPWREKPAARKEITSEQVAFITPGITKREDVIRELGQPYVEFPDLRIIAYTWFMRAGWLFYACIAPGAGGQGDLTEMYRYYTLLIAFDSADRVVKFEKKYTLYSSGDDENVRGQALKWLETQGLAAPKVPPMLVGKVIPSEESALYIYPQPGWNNPPFGGSWEIGVDEKIIGWLRKGEYLGIALAPGPHTVTVYYFWRDRHKGVRTRTSTYFETLRGQAHYLSVGQRKLYEPDPFLTVHPEGEALPVLKKMKPMP